MLRRPIKQGSSVSGIGLPNRVKPRTSNPALPLHHHHSSGRKVLPHGVAPTNPSSSTRRHVSWYLFQMIILLALGSTMIVLIHAITHRDNSIVNKDEHIKKPPTSNIPIRPNVPILVKDEPKIIDNVQQPEKPPQKIKSKPKPEIKSQPKLTQPKRRTTAEANEYMKSQPSNAVDGEKHIKEQLLQLKKTQEAGNDVEAKALITTRFLGYNKINELDGTNEKIQYWISNDRSKQDRSNWQKQMEELNLKKKEDDKILFPSLFGHVQDGVKPKRNVPMFADNLIIHLDDADKKDSTATTDTKEQVDNHTTAVEDEKKTQIDKEEPNKEQTDVVQRKEEFPSPAYHDKFPNSRVILKPTIGEHRSDADAIFAFAEGYDLNIYLGFIESLKATGFTGDLVLSVSALDSLKNGVEEYLRSHSNSHTEKAAADIDGNDYDDEVVEHLNVVVYTVKWNCFTGDGKLADGPNEGIRKCALVGMYGDAASDADEDNLNPIPDKRDPRPVATARYELYWAWSLKYDSHQWVMLIDSRDTYFQVNPFDGIVRNTREIEDEKDDGMLYFYAENDITSKIGDSKFNKNWLVNAYGNENVSSYFDKPIICSGSTMGEGIAIESYLRVMVAQFDNTNCKLKGCDQGFHNYLHYSGALDHAKGISEVKVFEQGKGIINNLALLRSKPLREWGLLNSEMGVLNWNGSVSNVAHQFDRDDELNKFVKGKRKEFTSDWEKRRAKK